MIVEVPTPRNTLTGQELTNADLQQVRILAERQIALEAEIATMQEKIEKLQEECLDVSQNKLPAAMLDIGLQSFVLASGASVTVEKYYSAKIPESCTSEAFKWIRDHGHEGLIKRNVTCKFGKGEDEQATKIVEAIMKMGVTPEDKTGVHPQTLKAFVREQVESGKEFPMELMGAYIGNRTKIAPSTK